MSEYSINEGGLPLFAAQLKLSFSNDSVENNDLMVGHIEIYYWSFTID